jgi:6-phosphogluconolactonase (cycloisomerase 2 family)
MGPSTWSRVTWRNIIEQQRFHLGTYTGSGGGGLGTGRIDVATGRPTIEHWNKDVEDPSWVTLGPDGRTLYAVSELAPDGLVSAFRLDGASAPALVNSVVTGAKPAHVVVHPDGRFLFTSLYEGGGVSVHPIEADGSVAPASDQRLHSTTGTQAHTHQVVIDRTSGDILVVDLGTDTVYVYRLDPATGTLTETGRTGFTAGSGPRHLAFQASGSQAYLVHELNSTVTVCGWADGALTPGKVHSTLPDGVSAEANAAGSNAAGEIVIAPDGRFVYISNRGANTIAVYSTDGTDLTLLASPSCGGDWPRHLALDHTGRWLYVANERSGDVIWFPRDPENGMLGPAAGRLPVAAVTQFELPAHRPA